MSPPPGGFEVRRIVVAVEGPSDAGTALEEAARLAARLHAELEGVFVQDVNLVRLAGLPVGREIHFLTGKGRDFTADALEDETRVQEFAARRAVAAAAASARVAFAFRTARGQVDAEVVSSAGGGDLLILGAGKPVPWGRGRLGRTARAAAESAPRSVLISKPGVRAAGVPLICCDGSAGSLRALEAGLHLFGLHEGKLAVLVLADTDAGAETLRRQVEERLAPLGVEFRFLHGARPEAREVCRLARDAGTGVLVMAADCPALKEPDRQRVLDSVACPILIVR